MKFVFYLVIIFFLALVFLALVFLLSFSNSGSLSDKGSSFECGFQCFSGSVSSFSMPFFVISLMFLLFDVEILLVCFFPIFQGFTFFSVFLIFFVLVLIFFLMIYEWMGGMLSWF